MKVLVLGGTGAMGTHLIDFLKADKSTEVIVTSRMERINHDNIKYVIGNPC